MNTFSNNKRIAKNTLLLYFRMIFMMLVALYTSRIVLNTLGVEDYGIYNVVGGIVAMFGFLNSSMSTTTMRYITYELGKGNFERLKVVFNTCQLILGIISVLVVVGTETVGVWFLYNKMQIPVDRMDAAFWVFQCSILATVVLIMSVPYNAIIVAHERMSAFAYISILEVVLKLAIVYLLLFFSVDKLILYAILILFVQFAIRVIYKVYCNKHFPETHAIWVINKALIKEMAGFTGWNLFGNIAAVLSSQGLNILLNIFFGPVVNAARAVSVQVQSAIIQFSSNFQMALNPQITKTYAADDYKMMHKLIGRSSKFTFFLLLFLSLPIMIQTDFVLTIWLKTVPDYTVTFLRIMLCTTIVDSVANPLMVAASATGRVRLYQSVVGGILLAILPVSYIILETGGDPNSVFIVHLIFSVIAFAVRLFIIRPMIKLDLSEYMIILGRIFMVVCLSLPLPLLYHYYRDNGFVDFIITCLLCMSTVSLSVYYIGLDRQEKGFAYSRIQIILQKIKLI